MFFDDLSKEVRRLYRESWQEDSMIEFKSGKGGIPGEMWPTYSAFANTHGGFILLGVEDDGTVSGVRDANATINAIFLQLNNPQKCSVNLCDNETIKPVTIGGKSLVAMYVPPAEPACRPVFIRNNEANCFLRRGAADILCKREDIIRMRRNRDIAESPSYSLDSVILAHSGMQDLDASSLRKYRLRMQVTSMGAAMQDLEDIPLLKKLGGYRVDRNTGEEGITMAGLLMFGTSDAISEFYPHFQLDYFEYDTGTDVQERWIDRITTDGTWPGNLFEFFYRVLPRLTQNLKLPFQLNDDLSRNESSPAHVAVREALANALVHADYFERFGIRIDQSPKGLTFTNPGSLLVDREQIFSDQPPPSICRNKGLQKMFQALGVVDRASSGIDKIVKGWMNYCIALPSVTELAQPDRVVWHLPYAGMISRERTAEVESRIGHQAYTALDVFDKLILICMPKTGYIGHGDMVGILPLHPADLSKRLSRLVSIGLLKPYGRGRGTRYGLADTKPVNGGQMSKPNVQAGAQPIDMALSNSMSREDLTALGHQMSKLAASNVQAGKPCNSQPGKTATEYPEIVLAVRAARKASTQDVLGAIVSLCQAGWISSSELAVALDRSVRTVTRHCETLISLNLLEAKLPGKPRSPRQAYRAKNNGAQTIMQLKKP